MTTPMGQPVTELVQASDRELHDEHVAAVATQLRLFEVLGERPLRAPAQVQAVKP